jgi:hypothetical protein
MLACAPERGKRTPTFSGAPWARKMLNGAVPASIAAAPIPAETARRVTPVRADVVGDLRIMRLLPGYRLSCVQLLLYDYSPMQDAMGY